MNSIAQEALYRLSVLQYAERHGVTQTARVYHCNRQFIYRLRWRYDGTPQSLLPKSRRPHSHPQQHTPSELALIRRMRRRHPHDGLIVLWVKLCQKGFRVVPLSAPAGLISGKAAEPQTKACLL